MNGFYERYIAWRDRRVNERINELVEAGNRNMKAVAEELSRINRDLATLADGRVVKLEVKEGYTEKSIKEIRQEIRDIRKIAWR